MTVAAARTNATFIPYLRRQRAARAACPRAHAVENGNRSTPLQGHGHVSRHAAGKIDDLDSELVSALAKVLRPELIDFLGHARQRVFPTRLLLIDGTTFVSAELVRKTVNLHLGQAVADRPLDDLDGASNSLLVGNAGGLAHMIDQ